MATIEWNAEGGTKNATVTSGNSGGASGDAFSNIAGTCTYSSIGKAHGALGMRYNTTAEKWRAYHVLPSSVTKIAGRLYLSLNALPGGWTSLYSFVGSDYAPASVIQVSSDGKFRLLDKVGGIVFTTSAGMSQSTVYRIEFQLQVGTTSSNGTFNVQYFEGDSTTAIESHTNTSANSGTRDIIRMQLGNNETSTVDFTFDDLLYGTATLTPVGPVDTVPPSEPTVNVDSITENPDSWTLVGAGDAPTALSDANESTYLETSDNPSASKYTVRLEPITAPPGYVRGRLQADSTGQTVKIELLQGATVRASTTATALTTSWADYELALTSTERSAIVTEQDGSVNNLDVRFTIDTL